MMTRWTHPQSFLVVLATLGSLAGTRSASAALVPVFTSVSVQSVQGQVSFFQYQVSFSSNGGTETLRPGDTLTFYDVGPMYTLGYTGGTPALATFTTSQPLVGVTPAGTAPTDNPLIANAVFTYSGAGTSTDFTFAIGMTQGTANPQTRRGTFTSTDSLAAGPNADIATVQSPTPVPEPLSIAGIGLAAAVGLVRRRRRA